jgi:hypothetical protein
MTVTRSRAADPPPFREDRSQARGCNGAQRTGGRPDRRETLMGKRRRSPFSSWGQDVTDDTKDFWDERTPRPIERHLRKAVRDPLADKSPKAELREMREAVEELNGRIEGLAHRRRR